MSRGDPTDRIISAWFELEAPSRVPDRLRTGVISATAAIRPRPAWRTRLKWSPRDGVIGGTTRRELQPVPALVLLGALLAAIVGIALVGSRLTAPPPLVVPTDPVHIAMPQPVMHVIVGDTAVWASTGARVNDVPTAIHRIDVETNEVTTVVPQLGILDHAPFVEAGGSIWIAQGDGNRLLRLDATTGREIDNPVVGDRPGAPYLAFGSVWTPNFRGRSITRVDLASGVVVATLEFPAFRRSGPAQITQGGGFVWAIWPYDQMLIAIDPATNRVAHEIKLPQQLCGVAYAAQRIWTTRCSGGPRIDVADVRGAIGTVRLGATRGSWPGIPVLDGGDRAWIPVGPPSALGPTRLVAVDGATLQVVDTFELGATGFTYAAGFDSLWIGSESEVIRLPVALLPRS